MLKCAGTNPNGFSSYETNIACPSAVTINSFAYNRPNADQAGWTVSNKSRVKNPTGDLLLTLAGAHSSCVVICIKARNAREGGAKTRT